LIKQKKLVAPVEGRDELLFELLRELRTELARKESIAPYMVFGDAALTQMAVLLPATKADFLEINGVGEKKQDKYGELFLNAIADYRSRHTALIA
jgi:ATP-dependent DNA helicase RecQ